MLLCDTLLLCVALLLCDAGIPPGPHEMWTFTPVSPNDTCVRGFHVTHHASLLHLEQKFGGPSLCPTHEPGHIWLIEAANAPPDGGGRLADHTELQKQFKEAFDAIDNDAVDKDAAGWTSRSVLQHARRGKEEASKSGQESTQGQHARAQSTSRLARASPQGDVLELIDANQEGTTSRTQWEATVRSRLGGLQSPAKIPSTYPTRATSAPTSRSVQNVGREQAGFSPDGMDASSFISDEGTPTGGREYTTREELRDHVVSPEGVPKTLREWFSTYGEPEGERNSSQAAGRVSPASQMTELGRDQIDIDVANSPVGMRLVASMRAEEQGEVIESQHSRGTGMVSVDAEAMERLHRDLVAVRDEAELGRAQRTHLEWQLHQETTSRILLQESLSQEKAARQHDQRCLQESLAQAAAANIELTERLETAELQPRFVLQQSPQEKGAVDTSQHEIASLRGQLDNQTRELETALQSQTQAEQEVTQSPHLYTRGHC